MTAVDEDYVLTDADAPAEDDQTAPEPQWDATAERSVLGAMLLSSTITGGGKVIEEVMDAVLPSDFYLPKHELIARAIGTVFNRNQPVDALTVGDELRHTEKLRQAGGDVYLHELTSVPPTVVSAPFWAARVKELAVRRRLVMVGTRIIQMGNGNEGHLDDMVDRARGELEQVMTGRRRVLRPMGESLLEVIDSLSEPPQYLRSPWEALDKLIGGFAPGALYVIGARPGSGKTIVALQCAARLAHEGVVAFSSLEMTEAELQLRLLAQYGPVHLTPLRTHRLSGDDWKRVAEARLRVQDAPIFVDETAGATMAEIRAHARAVARRGNLSAVVVDYLQLVEEPGHESRQVAVAAISKQLKQLAKDLQVPVIAAAQLRRSGERRGGSRKLPDLDDLRESGAIEQDADVVLLLDRDKEKAPSDLKVVVAKNRHGEQGKFVLHWQAQFARVQDKRWSPTALLGEEEV